MTIGAVAALSGRRPSSIRYYEQIGLLSPAARVSGRRVYGPDTIRTLAVIETGQRAGLTLGAVYTYQQYLRLSLEGFYYDQNSDSFGGMLQAMFNY